MNETTAAILVIGNEILSGKTEETNARFLITELRQLGVALRRIEIIPDDIEEIAIALRTLAARFTYVFTSGGVGPTHDDVTLMAVCQAFDVPMAVHPEIVTMIRTHLKDQVQPSHLRMAEVPQGVQLIRSAQLQWPVLAYQNVYILPGVPKFFQEKFLAIKDRFQTTQFHLKMIYTQEDEFAIAGHLESVAATYPQVSIGSYPVFDREDYRVKITLEAKESEITELAYQVLKGLLNQAKITIPNF